MKSLYCNGISDVQISKETKKGSSRLATASLSNVFGARLISGLRMVKTHCGHNIAIKASEWERFVTLHSSEFTLLKMLASQVKPL